MSSGQQLLFIGEPMLELTRKDEHSFGKSFAGDTYNTSVYLSRAFPTNDVYFMTAVGRDPLSTEFVSRAKEEDIHSDFIGRSEQHHLGAYMVVNDEHGERSFVYWRNDSAAKRMMSSLPDLLSVTHSKSIDTIFFSGITLAILLPKQRNLFWAYIAAAKESGCTIMFDPNYRPALWEDVDTAKQQIEQAFAMSDFLLPGVDDFTSLYGINTVEACIEFCRPFGFTELVIKQSEDPVCVVNQDGVQNFAIKQSNNVVDTTSAGDAFNGIYIGARLRGESCERAVELANFAAMQVIESPGAIMPKAKFMQAIKNW